MLFFFYFFTYYPMPKGREMFFSSIFMLIYGVGDFQKQVNYLSLKMCLQINKLSSNQTQHQCIKVVSVYFHKIYKVCRQIMIPRKQENSRQRFPLGQISSALNRNNSNQNSTQKQEAHFKYTPNQVSLNKNELNRLKQLKSKYNKSSQTQDSKNRTSSRKEKQLDTSFKQIEIVSLVKNDNNYTKTKQFVSEYKSSDSTNKQNLSRKSSLYNDDFERKIQQSSNRVESSIERVQDKLNILRQIYHAKCYKSHQQILEASQQTCRQHNTLKSYQNIKSREQPRFVQSIQPIAISAKRYNTTKIMRQKNNQSIDDPSIERTYAQQLKSINFIDEIKRKIKEIENEKKSNIQKKVSEISRASKTTTDKPDQKNYNKNQHQMTLANLIPNLAQSEVIETTQRQRNTQRNTTNKRQSIQSLVFQNYKFPTLNERSRTRQFFSDKIMEDPQIEDMSLRASPILGKSPIGQTNNLQETQMIERNSLKGDLEIVEQEIQREFVLLINRLGYQAEIDNRFASELFKYDNIFTQKQSLKSIIVGKLKEHYTQNHLPFDERMFEVSQMQLDPLASVQKIYKEYSPQQIMKVGFGLKKLYDKNCYYFENKLLHCFSVKTIQFLIDELQKCHSLNANQEMNVGHLTSYVNMRTGKDLRNRYLYRILKRIVRNGSKIGSTFRKEDLLQAFVRN